MGGRLNIEGAVAIVTGAASGIGAALARSLADRGAAAVVLVDRDAAGVAAVADGLDLVGADDIALARPGDVTDRASLDALVAEILARWGRIDLLCANAGITTDGGLDAPDDRWAAAWDVHVLAHVHAARAVLPAMRERGRGWILITASAAGLLTAPGDAPYAVTKHAAVGLAEWIAITHGGDGVGVSVLCPMGVDTPMTSGSGDGPPRATAAAVASGELVSAEHVAEVALRGVAEERFLLLPHPEVAGFWVDKATDPDRWIARMRRRFGR